MTSLSIALPDELAKASQKAAQRLGISRTAFIRQAIQHELEGLAKREAQTQIAQALLALQKDPKYQQELDDLDNADFPTLPDEQED